VREKLAFFALSLGSCAVTLAAQAPAIGQAGLALRLGNSLLAYPAYLALVFWPARLAVLYPYRGAIRWSEVLGAAALIAAITLLALWRARRRPWLLVGWLWFAGMLVPTVGLVQVGVQAYADRYTYLPFVGVALALAFGGAELVDRTPRARPLATAFAACAAVLLLGVLTVKTRAQVEVWRDTETLFAQTLAVTQANWFAHGELGIALAARGEPARARSELEASLRIRPRYPRALANLGLLSAQTGQLDEGIAQLRRALELDPTLRDGERALGIALEPTGRLAEAATAYRAALALDPGDRSAALQLARLLAISPDASLRDGALAVELCERACGASGCQTAETLDILAMAYMEAGRRADAVLTAQRALELARASGDAKLAAKIEGRRAAYERGEPVRVRLTTPSPGG
jgi:tetratricopeptide (TPR) repeat protein